MLKLISLVLVLLLSGCQSETVTARTKIIFKCIDGRLVADSYVHVGYSPPTDILNHKHSSNELIIQDGITIWCENTSSSK